MIQGMAEFDEDSLVELMRRANAGDAAAYTAFLRALLPPLRRLARTLLVRNGGRVTEAEDVVQEVLLAIHLKRHTWREDTAIGPWLWAITRYKCVDMLRRRRRAGQEVDIDALAETLAGPPEDDATLRSDLERVVDRLEGKSGAIVKAIGLNGEEVSDVARRLSMSDGAVRVALHRGLKRLAAIAAKVE